MFTTLRSQFNLRQSVTFAASLGLESAALVILCCVSSSHMPGPSLRSSMVHSSPLTPIYFQRVPDAALSISKPAPDASLPAPKTHPVPELASQAKPDAEPAVDAQAGTMDDGSGSGEGSGLAPFPKWTMNSMASGFAGMHHQIKGALPVFTPDPPILHGEVPEPARGKDIVVNVVIDEGGSIAQVEVLQGVGYGVENSIVETLRRWIFVPAKINGVAIASQRQLRFHFPA
jgi:TonB family protein